MRPKAIEVHLPIVNEIADEFIERLKCIVDDTGHVSDLRNEISKWNMECKCVDYFVVNSFDNHNAT